MEKKRIEELLAFEDLHVMVLGDVMLDEYIQGKADRISPEAPVPVIKLEERAHKLGGAANVAMNLTNLELRTSLIGIIGNDESGKHIEGLCARNKMLSATLIKDDSRVTTCKSRILAGSQHLLRIDSEDDKAVTDKIVDNVLELLDLRHKERAVDIIIFQDYNKGFFSPEMINKLMLWVKKNSVFSCLDPKVDNIGLFEGIDLFKPNRKEMDLFLGEKSIIGKDKLKASSKQVFQKLSASWLVLTLSSRGIFIASNTECHHEETESRSIIDVSGAGDTVLAITSMLIYQGKANIAEICKIANYAGAAVCNIPGVGLIDKKTLLSRGK